MCSENETVKFGWNEIKKFNKYLVFYSPDEEKTGIKGIRDDAPPDVIKEFIEWYRDNNRYENGRIRPLSEAMVRKLIVPA